MPNDKKIKLLIAMIALFACITQIRQTYAKYTESKSGSADFNVANWQIKINNQDINENVELSSLINPVYDNNTNIANGVIAPGSQGNFVIGIDATNTQVSFQYSISIASANNSDVADFKIYAYRIGTGEIVQVTNSASITNTINNSDQNKTVNITVYFKWTEGSGETMNNAADTAASLGNGSGKLSVTAAFTQVV